MLHEMVVEHRPIRLQSAGADCIRKFKAAWERFADDEANLTLFMAEKRRARRAR
jgi:hypothetical protein